MSSFTTPLEVSPLSSGSNWELTKAFTYHVGSEFSRHYIHVPKGFKTDFASVPKVFFFLPDWATYNKSAVLHDWLYYCKAIKRKEADAIFLEAMLVDWRKHKSRYFVARLEYYAVRLFGWLAWKGEPLIDDIETIFLTHRKELAKQREISQGFNTDAIAKKIDGDFLDVIGNERGDSK